MPGDFGELTVNIGLGINFLAGGTFISIQTTPCLMEGFPYSDQIDIFLLGLPLSKLYIYSDKVTESIYNRVTDLHRQTVIDSQSHIFTRSNNHFHWIKKS